MATAGSFPGVRQSKCKADPSPPSSAEVKTEWRSHTSTPPVYLRGLDNDNFTFTMEMQEAD